MKWLIVDKLTRARLMSLSEVCSGVQKERKAERNKGFRTYVDSKALTLKP